MSLKNRQEVYGLSRLNTKDDLEFMSIRARLNKNETDRNKYLCAAYLRWEQDNKKVRPKELKPFRSRKGRKRVIVAGSRSFNDWNLLCTSLDELTHNYRDPVILTGGAKGADQMAMEWAGYLWYLMLTYHPNWAKYGKSAGIIRNAKMVKDGDVLIAFWDGKSPGTKHIIEHARKKGLKVKVVMFKPKPKIKITKEKEPKITIKAPPRIKIACNPPRIKII